MQVAAAALVALAAASAAAGWYSLAAFGAGVLLAGAIRSLPGPEPDDLGERGVRRWIPAGLAASVAVARTALAAAVFAAYLAPAYLVIAAPALVLAVAVADMAGARVNTYYRRWLAGLLLVAVAVFLAVCLTIPPAPRVTISPELGGAPGLAGGLLALAVATVPLSALRPGSGGWLRRYAGPGIAVAAVLAVAATAMYQLGPVRFGLSGTSLRAVFVASDARTLLPVLAVAVVVATLPAALDGMRQARTALGGASASRWRRAVLTAPCAVAAAALAGVFEAVPVLLVCAVLVLGHALALAVLVLRRGRDARAAVIVVVAAVLLVVVPVSYLLIGFAVAAVAVGGVFLHERVASPR